MTLFFREGKKVWEESSRFYGKKKSCEIDEHGGRIMHKHHDNGVFYSETF
jgi:hypothetical protein